MTSRWLSQPAPRCCSLRRPALALQCRAPRGSNGSVHPLSRPQSARLAGTANADQPQTPRVPTLRGFALTPAALALQLRRAMQSPGCSPFTRLASAPRAPPRSGHRQAARGWAERLHHERSKPCKTNSPRKGDENVHARATTQPSPVWAGILLSDAIGKRWPRCCLSLGRLAPSGKISAIGPAANARTSGTAPAIGPLPSGGAFRRSRRAWCALMCCGGLTRALAMKTLKGRSKGAVRAH